MRRLMLLRHAKTETDSPSGRDQDRRLDERGHKDAARIGGWIGRHPPFPDFVQVSPAVRAQQTWEIAWEEMKEHVQSIRMAAATDPKRMMLVGHNPGMHELALTLAGSGDAAGRKALADNLPTAGLVIFDFDIKDWNDVAFRKGRLMLFVSPKLLKQASDDD